MTEVGELSRNVVSKDFWGNLNSEDVINLRQVSNAINAVSERRGVDAHLIVVGGTVDPKRRGQTHKDIDLVLFSDKLAIENSPSGGVKNFDRFSDFLDDALGNLGWDKDTIEPYWQDFDRSSDGSITYKPIEGKPIEILPVRVDSLRGGFEEYLAEQKRPYCVIF